jgi:hypothetical protein
MRNIMQRTMAALILTAATAAGSMPARAQVAVFDSTSYAELVEQMQNLQQQLLQLQSLYSQAQQSYAAITGGRGMDVLAPVLNTVRTAVPNDYGNNMVLPSALSAFGDIANGAASIVRQSMQVTAYPGNTFYQTEIVRYGDRAAAELAAAQAIYDTAVTRRTNLDLLRQQLATTTDQATAAQLNVRVATETSQGINDLNQINAMLLLQRSNESIDGQRAMEAESVEATTALNGLLGN